VYEPTVPTAPDKASAAQTASRNDIPLSGSSESNTRHSANTKRLRGTASLRLTAAASTSRARSAAWMAALPIINVTRLE